MNSIGLDAHSATFTVAALSREGKLMFCLTRRTTAENLSQRSEATGR